jgi:hypothetical protein
VSAVYFDTKERYIIMRQSNSAEHTCVCVCVLCAVCVCVLLVRTAESRQLTADSRILAHSPPRALRMSLCLRYLTALGTHVKSFTAHEEEVRSITPYPLLYHILAVTSRTVAL